MEPIFAESASETVTAKLRAQLDAAVAALPPPLRTSCLTLKKQLTYSFKTRPLRRASLLLQSLLRHTRDKLYVYT